MFGHARCLSIETLLRSQIIDLQAELDKTREAATNRERELLDRVMALTNPSALATSTNAGVARVASATPGMPALIRRPVPVSAGRHPLSKPRTSQEAMQEIAGLAEPGPATVTSAAQ